MGRKVPIDYFLVSERFITSVKKSEILSEIHGSDHCPVKLEIELEEIKLKKKLWRHFGPGLLLVTSAKRDPYEVKPTRS